MYGIICAMECEAKGLIADTKNAETQVIAGIKYTTGTLCGKDVVIAERVIGKVFGAMCTQIMIDRFKPTLIINTGVAGSLSKRFAQGNVCVASNVVQHDVDTTAVGDVRGMISGINKINFKTDPTAYEKLIAIATELGTPKPKGLIASGDVFVADKKQKDFIANWFGAYAVDMESGAIGQVCYMNNQPFAVIRSMSDNADGKTGVPYEQFKAIAAENATKVIETFLERE